MKDIIYLICSKNKVESMRKTLPDIRRDEIVVKLKVEVDPKVYGTPTIEKEVHVEDWVKGIDLKDVEFRQNVITKEEAEIIRQRRLDRMKKVLEEQGYKILPPKKENKEKISS